MHYPRVLIVGGNGFIATHLTALLLASNYDITSLDPINEVSNPFYIDYIDPHYKLVKKSSAFLINMDLTQYDYIIFAAAQTHVDMSLKNPYSTFKDNIDSVLDLMRELYILKGFNKKIPKILIFSSDEIMAGVPLGTPNRIETDPVSIYKVTSPYASSKLAAESIVWSYMITYDLPIIIVRPCNNFGEGQHKSKYIPRMIELAKAGSSLQVYGKGQEVREWIYVEDCCKVVKLLMEEGLCKHVYHVCSGIRYNNIQIAKKIAEKYTVPIEFVKQRTNHDFTYNISSIYNYDIKYKDVLHWLQDSK